MAAFRSTILRLSVVFAAMQVLAALAAADTYYNIYNIAPQFGSSTAMAINNKNQVVGHFGWSSSALSTGDGYLWTVDSGIRLLPKAFSRRSNGLIDDIRPNAINDKGQIAGTAIENGAGWSMYTAARWDSLTSYGYMKPTGWRSYGQCINNYGFVGGVMVDEWMGTATASIWDTSMNGHTDVTWEAAPQLWGLNDSMVAVGWHSTWGVGGSTAYKWTSQGGLQKLPIGNNASSGAYAISNTGTIVGYVQATNSSNEALAIWDQQDNLSSPCNGTGRAINNTGGIVGNDGELAFAWNKLEGMYYLRDRVIGGSGWVLKEARGINDRGWIVGNGTLNGVDRGFLLVPTSDPNGKSGISAFTFTPKSIDVLGYATPEVKTYGKVSKVVIKICDGQGMPPLPPISLVRNGDSWTSSKPIPGTLFIKATSNPVRFIATATTEDSGSPTMWAELNLNWSNSITGTFSEYGDKVSGVICDNPSNYDEDIFSSDTSIANNTFLKANKVELRLPTTVEMAEDYGSMCLNSSGSSVDKYGNRNSGTIIVKNGKAWYLPPDELNVIQNPSSASEVQSTPYRDIKVRLKLKGKDNNIYTYGDATITLARPAVMFVHGINTGPDGFSKLISRMTPGYFTTHSSHIDDKHFKGNGMVEEAASLLGQNIQNTLWRLRADKQFGRFVKARNYGNSAWATKRMDVIAWSYGGLITRWYIQSRGDSDILSETLGWYQRKQQYEQTYSFSNISPAEYKNDIRKVLTLGSMWRGVPMCNYANEVFDLGNTNSTLGEQPTILPIWNLRKALLNAPSVRFDLPAEEVMAVNSPWLEHLNTTQAPFDKEVKYGAVGGDDQNYQIRFLGVPIIAPDVHHIASILSWDNDNWFPYTTLETRLGDANGFNDGIVPLWSALIPGGSSIVVHSDHSGLPSNSQTYAYINLQLNDTAMKCGKDLIEAWYYPAAYVESEPRKYGNRFRWVFDSGSMAPYPQSLLYKRIGDVGRVEPLAIKEIQNGSLSFDGITLTSTWSTIIPMNRHWAWGSDYYWLEIDPTKIHSFCFNGQLYNKSHGCMYKDGNEREVILGRANQ